MCVYSPKGSNGFYAQCDGAVCFTSTQGEIFPYFRKLARDEIMCSCPITDASGSKVGFETSGPYDLDRKKSCNRKYFKQICNNLGKQGKKTKLFKNGAIIGVGAPPGTSKLLANILKKRTKGRSGEIPESNQCRAKP